MQRQVFALEGTLDLDVLMHVLPSREAHSR